MLFRSKDGDKIIIDVKRRSIMLDLSDEEIKKRKSEWKPKEPKITKGYLKRYSKLVTSSSRGAILE